MDIASFFKKRKLEKVSQATQTTEIAATVLCPVCGENITDLFLNKRNEHVDKCLSGDLNSTELKKIIQEETEVSPLETISDLGSPANSEKKQRHRIRRSSSSIAIKRSLSSLEEKLTLNSERNPIVISDEDSSAREFQETDIVQKEIEIVETDQLITQTTKAITTLKSSAKKTTSTKNKPSKIPKNKRIPKPKPLPPSFKTLKFPELEELIMVDGFQFSHPQINKFFLSHFHSDHYIGLNKSFTDTIYCSEITGKLLQSNMNFDPDLIFPMNLTEKYEILPNLFVELIDANHCPGAVLFLFEYFIKGELSKRILHTGDFRFCFKHYERFKDMRIDEIYLDTTYFIINRGMFYVHPIQKNLITQACEDIESVIETMSKKTIFQFFNKSGNDGGGKLAIVLGIYSIGKENLFLNLSKHLKVKIYTLKRHIKTLSQYLRSLENIEVYSDINKIKDNRFIVLVPLRHLRDLKLTNLNYKVIKIQPTGWTGRLFIPKEIEDPIDKISFIFNIDNKRVVNSLDFNSKIVQLPYSEHSNIKELMILLNKLQYGKITPTVSVDNQGDHNLIPEIQKLQISEQDVEDYFEITKPELNDFYIYQEEGGRDISLKEINEA